MNEVIRRYFWCDAPSPLHDILTAFLSAQSAFAKLCVEKAESVGGTTLVGRRHVEGVVFASRPDEKQWRKVGVTPAGERYYLPVRTSKARRDLHKQLVAMQMPRQESMLAEAGLTWDVFAGRYLHHSVMGWKDERIFVSIPFGGLLSENGGKTGPDIPAYLTECKEWEQKRWFDLGRDGVSKQTAETA